LLEISGIHWPELRQFAASLHLFVQQSAAAKAHARMVEKI
jgi:hypothetical protein